VNIDLSTDSPPEPENTLKLAQAFAAIARTLNHHTRHHEALEYPGDADLVIRELSSAAGRLPQLLSQVGAWLEREQAAGRIAVTSAAGNSHLPAAMSARLRLERAAQVAWELQQALDYAAAETCGLAAAPAGEGDGDE
jgi:hypothetical protein